MHLVAIGLNHKTAPVEVRERLAVSEGNLPIALETLIARHCVSECCILSTCNRTEIYAIISRREDEDRLVGFMSDHHGIPAAGFHDHIYRHRGHKAVEHLFRVSAGIDSMMLGETQIMHQVKNAYCVAGESESTSTVLNNLFQHALFVGKRARTETDISRGAFSVGAAAVELATSIFGELNTRRIVILGAGKMSELAARRLVMAGTSAITVLNRTFARAEELAAKLGGTAKPWESMVDALTAADIVISSTGADGQIIDCADMEKTMRARSERPIFLIDIAVPRDIDPAAGELNNVFLYNIDDLEQLVLSSTSERNNEVEKVQRIIKEETERYVSWLRTLEAVPLIKQLREKLETLRDAEWERTAPKLAHLSEKDQEAIRVMMRSLVNKVSHHPLVKMKEYASSADGEAKLDVAREMFGLNGESAESANGVREKSHESVDFEATS